MTSNNNSLLRLRIVAFLVIFIAGFFIVRLFYLQVVRGAEYLDTADRQYLKSATTFYNRGSIFFSNKDGTLVPAATLKQQFLLTINPELISNPDLVYNELSKVVTIDYAKFVEQANADSSYREVLKGLDQATAEKISDLNLRGVSLYKEKIREYPAGNTASHVIGFIGYQGDEYAGRYGLELAYDDVLSHEESGSFSTFLAEIFLGLSGSFLDAPERPSGDLILTIEPRVQNMLEESLIETLSKWNADGAGAIVMNPKTGKIIAMSALPNFNPTGPIADVRVLPNPLTENVYEMGSVVKPLTVASGLDSGVIKTDSIYNDLGTMTLNGRTFSNYDGRARGTVPVQEILNQSLNTGVAHIMQLMGVDKFRKYMLSFGIGEKTGIDLPNEVAGLVSNLQSDRQIEHATASFGQGIALTPIGITRAFSALANGGFLVKPYVVSEIKYTSGLSDKTETQILDRAISKKASEDITKMLIKTVDTALANGQYSMDRYTIAAKTGTAQISDPVNGGYYPDRYLHSFFGYYPAYNPEFIVFIYLIEPKNVRYASETLSEPFFNLAEFLLNYYEVAPDR